MIFADFISVRFTFTLLFSVLFINLNARQIPDSLQGYSTEELLDLTWRNRNTNPELSTIYGQAAIAMVLEKQDSASLPRAYGFTGVAYRNLDQYIKALEYYVKGWQSSININDPEEQAYAYMNLANLNLYIRRPEKSKEYLESLSEILDVVNNENIQGYYYHNYGRTLMVLEEYVLAQENLEKAMELRRSQGNLIRVSVCEKYLGDLYKRREKFDLAEQYYSKSIAGLTPSIDKQLYGTLLADLSLISTRNGDIDTARDYAVRALALGEEVGSKLRQREAHEALAEVERSLKNYSQVQIHLDKVIELNQDLFGADLELQADLFDYELSLKELEFEREKERIEYQAAKSRITYIALAISTFVLVVLFFGGRYYIQKQKLVVEQENNRKITELNQQLESKVEKRTEELKEQNEKLEQLSTYKLELTNMLAHDLKSPLGVIVGYSDLIQEKSFGEKIRDSATSMLKMIYNMLDVQRFEEANMQLNLETVGLPELYARAEKMVLPIAQNRGVDLSLKANDSYNLKIDRDIIVRVLANLFDNALKHTSQGGSIDLKVTVEKENFLTLVVSDTGVGIEEQDLDHLFDKFWQKNPERQDTVQSTGLGLSFCKMAVEEHGGGIYARSKKGKGTSIYFELPIAG